MSSDTGILFVNLGSPKSPSVPDVKAYLSEFLMDPKVIDLPYPLRYVLVNGVICRTRPAKSAEAYKAIWQKDGSPLITMSLKVAESIQSQCEHPLECGMRYGQPSIRQALETLIKRCDGSLSRVMLLPQYPHYAMSSYETVVDKVKEELSRLSLNVDLKILPPFYNNPDYIKCLAESISPYLEDDFDQLLFSYHGVPERHIKKSDITSAHCLQTKNCCTTPSLAHTQCYRHHCLKTTELCIKALGVSDSKVSNSFQSRLGKDPWLTPFTDEILKSFPEKGIKKLCIVCPSFTVDCLETLEEIGQEGRDLFLSHGGEKFTLIPCLNNQESYSKFMAQWVKLNL